MNHTPKSSSSGKRRSLMPLFLCAPFLAIYGVCEFVVPGYSFTALVCLCIIGVILFYTLMPLLSGVAPRFVSVVTKAFTICLMAGLLVVAATEAVIIHASFGTPERSAPYMVVLGAKVNADGPSVSLMDRIQGAYTYLSAHPEVTAVVSGGQGNDEHITEAQCMFDHLVAMGIDPERIWMEDQASSTWENMQFSLNLIEEKTGSRPTELAILSSEYHLFRASLFARACGVDFIGVPARTSRPSQMINHFMREVAGVWHYILLGGTYRD